VLAAAKRIAGHASAERIDAAHIAAGLLSEPDGIAARVIHGAGISDEQLYAAFGLQPAAAMAQAADGGADAAAIRALRFTSAGKAVLKGSLKAALRLGHNYIGTEHLLLGILFADGDAARTLVSTGLDADRAEASIADEFARIQAQRRA
jgi:ATP-dependent Clp protease ATP-binding subunit ClpA